MTLFHNFVSTNNDLHTFTECIIHIAEINLILSEKKMRKKNLIRDDWKFDNQNIVIVTFKELRI